MFKVEKRNNQLQTPYILRIYFPKKKWISTVAVKSLSRDLNQIFRNTRQDLD